MEVLQETKDAVNNSFVSHVFSTTEEDKGELLNVIQYSLMGVIPVIIMNKMIQRFIPEADPEKSSLELLAEIAMQLIVIFGSLVFIHRMITYIPSYSGFKYENLTLTNVILTFLIIILSIQTKMGIKVNIMVDRVSELWNGPTQEKKQSKGGRGGSNHTISQADYIDNSQIQGDMFPPAPVMTTKTSSGGGGGGGGYDQMRGSGAASASQMNDYSGPMAANSVLGGSFGSFF